MNDGPPNFRETIEALLAPLSAKLDALGVELEARRASDYFSIKTAAALIEVSPDHVRRAVTSGHLPCANVGTSARPLYRISRGDLIAWVEKRKHGAPPTAPRRRAAVPPRSRHHRSPPAGPGRCP